VALEGDRRNGMSWCLRRDTSGVGAVVELSGGGNGVGVPLFL
jgi:hypothetical protein